MAQMQKKYENMTIYTSMAASGTIQEYGIAWKIRYETFTITCSNSSVQCSLDVKDSNQHQVLIRGFNHLQPVENFPLANYSYGGLPYHVEIAVVNFSQTKSPETIADIIKKSVEHDFKNFKESGELSDFVFEIDGKDFKAHKQIVAARSPVLTRMLSSQYRETSDNRMKIDDVTQETFAVFLGYLYVEPLPELDQKQASDLMVIADKYEVSSLKEICCGLLQESFKKDPDFDSAAEIFQIAHKHQCTQALIDAAFNVIRSKFNGMGYKIKDELAAKPEKILKLIVKKQEFEKE